jgi:hypothetical protein
MPGGKWRLGRTRDRLLSRVEEGLGGCWRWKGFINLQGYGTTSYYGRRGTPAHRAMYMEFVGPIADGFTLDHLCHTRDAECAGGPSCLHRRCVNPAHLEPVTSEENSSRGVFGRRTHCPAGHAYDGDNLIVTSNGGRACRECARQRGRDRLAAQRASRPADWTPRKRKRPAHCAQGHPFDQENTFTRPDGRRGCKECRRARTRAYRAAQVQEKAAA